MHIFCSVVWPPILLLLLTCIDLFAIFCSYFQIQFVLCWIFAQCHLAICTLIFCYNCANSQMVLDLRTLTWNVRQFVQCSVFSLGNNSQYSKPSVLHISCKTKLIMFLKFGGDYILSTFRLTILKIAVLNRNIIEIFFSNWNYLEQWD